MPIPLPTTTIAVLRAPAAAADSDGYDEPGAATAIATGVRAHLSQPVGIESIRGGSRQITTLRLLCDPTDLMHTDQVRDETTGLVYDVLAVLPRPYLGLEHVAADLVLSTGTV